MPYGHFHSKFTIWCCFVCVYSRKFILKEHKWKKHWSIGLSVCPSVCLSVRLSICLFVCLSVCPSVNLTRLSYFSISKFFYRKSKRKKHSDNADTSTFVTFDRELWPWPLVKVKNADDIRCRFLYCTLVPGRTSMGLMFC